MQNICNLLNLFFKIPEKARFLLVGGFNTLTGYIVFILLYSFFKDLFHYNFILLTQYLITITISYLNMKFFVFRTTGNYLKEYIKVFSTYLLTYFLNAILLALFIEGFSFNPIAGQGITLVILVLCTYMLHKYINFKQ